MRRPPPPPSNERVGWLLVIASVVVVAAGIAWVLGVGTGRTASATTPPPGATPTSAASSEPSPAATAEPIPTDSLDPSPTTLEPTPTLGSTPTLEPTTPPPVTPPPPTPSPFATLEPVTGLSVVFPSDGEVVGTRVINVVGNGPPGVTVTRDIPLWFDDHVTVRADGIWMLPVELSSGPNQLTFRIGDEIETELRLTVLFRPRG